MGAGAEERDRLRAEKALTRRVAITGFGLVSCLGNEPEAVEAALRGGRSGIDHAASFEAAGLRCRIAGLPTLHGMPPVERKARRFMGLVALYAHHALRKAIAHSGLEASRIRSPRTGLIVGSSVGSLSEYVHAVDALRAGGLRRMPPYVAPQAMGSTASAALATSFGILGRSYSVSAACASSAHAIGQGAELVRAGIQDIVLAGGAEEAEWTTAAPFDAMGALSTAHNAQPQRASRPFDRKRDGFILAGGAGMLVLEDLEHARKRGAQVLAELAGYGSSSAGDMIHPSPAAAAAAMRAALVNAGVDGVDYVNAHAVSSPVGDAAELDALRQVFAGAMPAVSSTKGLAGHSLGASGAQEAIHCLLMMTGGFIAGNANLETPDPAAEGILLPRETTGARVRVALSNNFGFGGTHASLVFVRP